MMHAGMTTTYNYLRNSGAWASDVAAILGKGGLGHLAVQFSNKRGLWTMAIEREKARRSGMLQEIWDYLIKPSTAVRKCRQ